MYDRDKFRLLTCFHCGNKGLLTICHKETKSYGGPVEDWRGEIVDFEPLETFHWYTLTCPVCNKVTLWECFDAEYMEHPETTTLYPQSAIDTTGVPESIKSAFESALKVKNIDTAICSLALRRVLEAICKDKGAEGNTLEKMIANMIEREILPSTFDDACWIIRQMGNSAAHADQKDFLMYHVNQTIDFVQSIINYLYTLPVKIKKLRGAIEAEKKPSKSSEETQEKQEG